MPEAYQVKEYPLEVERASDDIYFSKGWQPKTEFLERAKYEAESMDWDMGWDEDDVRYEVWRCVPGGPYDDYPMYYWPAQLGTPGAFPVTVVGG